MGRRPVRDLELAVDNRDRSHGFNLSSRRATVEGVTGALSFMDDDEGEVLFDHFEAKCLWNVTSQLDAATVSACPDCRSRVVASVALIDLISDSPPFPHGSELMEFAEEAPTLHLYVVDLQQECAHDNWLDPLYDEWADVVDAPGPTARR
jgi:hypothetical protein